MKMKLVMMIWSCCAAFFGASRNLTKHQFWLILMCKCSFGQGCVHFWTIWICKYFANASIFYDFDLNLSFLATCFFQTNVTCTCASCHSSGFSSCRRGPSPRIFCDFDLYFLQMLIRKTATDQRIVFTTLTCTLANVIWTRTHCNVLVLYWFEPEFGFNFLQGRHSTFKFRYKPCTFPNMWCSEHVQWLGLDFFVLFSCSIHSWWHLCGAAYGPTILWFCGSEFGHYVSVKAGIVCNFVSTKAHKFHSVAPLKWSIHKIRSSKIQNVNFCFIHWRFENYSIWEKLKPPLVMSSKMMVVACFSARTSCAKHGLLGVAWMLVPSTRPSAFGWLRASLFCKWRAFVFEVHDPNDSWKTNVFVSCLAQDIGRATL